MSEQPDVQITLDEPDLSPLAQVAQVVAALLGENPEVFARADGPRITMYSAGVCVVLTAVSVSADVELVLEDEPSDS